MGLTRGVKTHSCQDKFHHIVKQNVIGYTRVACLCLTYSCSRTITCLKKPFRQLVKQLLRKVSLTIKFSLISRQRGGKYWQTLTCQMLSGIKISGISQVHIKAEPFF